MNATAARLSTRAEAKNAEIAKGRRWVFALLGALGVLASARAQPSGGSFCYTLSSSNQTSKKSRKWLAKNSVSGN
jgi:hypothetical protein